MISNIEGGVTPAKKWPGYYHNVAAGRSVSYRSVLLSAAYSCGIAWHLNKNAVLKKVVTLIRISRNIIGK
ncbi:hypothetical protein [Pantoea sp. ARC607]|uniref:hypothetical protein n=1 Tax=unclassified Pantoea TaxID=2630326 RepID=UPI0018F540DF|nr:hypothetical protein [Pantoea sp. ARC607]